MDESGDVRLTPRATPGASVAPIEGGWRLSIPAGPAGVYRWAQLDDYLHLPRRAFHWRPPMTFELEARASAPDLPGTWGFGLWNDPFNLSLGIGGTTHRAPALPQAAWFFHASPENYLSLRDDLPACGFLAATFHSTRFPPALLAAGLPFLPLLAWKAAARRLRRMARRFVSEGSTRLDLDPSAWHIYAIRWRADEAAFSVDGKPVFSTAVSPTAPLGLVLWIDNQFAAFTPQGKLATGTQSNPAAWLDLRAIKIK
jgi:hypothetical protein